MNHNLAQAGEAHAAGVPALAAAGARVCRILDRQTILRRLVEQAVWLLEARAGAAGLMVAGGLSYTEYLHGATWNQTLRRFDVGEGAPGHVLAEARACSGHVADFAALALSEVASGDDWLVEVPVQAVDGRLLASLEVILDEPTPGCRHEVLDLLHGLAVLAASALDNARMLSEFKRAGAEVRESESRYRSLFEDIQQALLICCPETLRIESVNRACEALFQLGRDELLGRDFVDLLPLDDDRQALRHLLQAGTGHMQLRRTRTDGEAQQFDLYCSDQTVAGKRRLLLSLLDLSGQVRAEEALDRNRRRQAQLLDQIHEVVFQTDAEHRWDFLNPAWTALTRLPVGQCIGRPVLDFVAEPDRAALRQALQGLENGGDARLEIRLRGGEGEDRWVAISIKSLIEAGQPFRGAFGTLSDITERRRADEIMRVAAEALGAETGEAFFQSLVQSLTSLLTVDYAVVGELHGADALYTLAVQGDGRRQPNFNLQLPGTACELVARGRVCLEAEGVAGPFGLPDLLGDGGGQGFAGVPLKDDDGQVIGVLVVAHRQSLPNPALAESVLRVFAVRAAAEIQRQRHESDRRRRDAILNAISFSTAHLLGEAIDGDSMRAVLGRLADAAQASHAYLYQNEKDLLGECLARCRYDWAAAAQKGDGKSFVSPLRYARDGFQRWQFLLERGKAISDCIDDMPPRESRFFRERGVSSVLAVPVFVDGEWWGFMGLESCHRRFWSDPEMHAAYVAADVLGAAVARIEARDRLQLAASVLESTSEGVTVTTADGTIIAVNDAFTRITGYTEEEAVGHNPRLLQSGIHEAPFYAAMWRSISETGHWQGEIWNRRKSGEVYPEWLSISTVKDPMGRISHRVGVFSDITAFKESQAQLDHMAHHDALTGLPNRVMFHLRLEHAVDLARRNGRQVGLLFLDLDRFKQINDTLGHAAGDELLQTVARRLGAQIRRQDTLARLGGDEFVLVMEGVDGAGQVATVARKMLAALEQPIIIDKRELFIGGSIGIAVFPGDGDDVETLLRNADTAMYRAKEAGRGNYQFYLPEMTESAMQRMLMENSLRHALNESQLRLEYLPVMDLADDRVTGVEALVRWEHPERGLLPPAEFLPAADEARLMPALTEWVLNQACGQAARWREDGLSLDVSVNLAGSLLGQTDLVAMVGSALRESGLPAGGLEVEITEEFMLGQADTAVDALRGLRALGVRTAVDDFGTGYFSLGRLRRLPVDKLKIDRGFIAELPGDADAVAVARAVISLARHLGLVVLAEGVESLAQLDFLRHEDCQQVQGFQLARPMSAAALQAWLRERGQ